jgi:hypothetical protein
MVDKVAFFFKYVACHYYFTSACYLHNHLSQMLGVIVAVDGSVK